MKFSDIYGGENVKRSLVSMADSGRVAHAMLFFENEGSGGLPLALAYAQYLNCSQRHDGDSCGECPSCRKMEKLIHPDVHFVYPVNTGSKAGASEKPTSDTYLKYWRELVLSNPYFLESELYDAIGIEGKSGNIAVAEAKGIIEKLSLASVEGGYKTVVVWLPEKMNAEAANRLLKIVEEPPAETVFLFITHSPEKVLQTIFSRCQSVRIPPMSKENVAKTLEQRFGMEPGEAFRQAAIAGGSVGTALHGLRDREDYDRFYDLFSDLMSAVLSRDFLSALEAGEAMASLESREKQKAFCTFAGECIRKIFLLQKGMKEIANVPEGEYDFFSRAASGTRPAFCTKTSGYLDGAVAMIDRNVSPKIVFCDLVDRIFISI